MSSLTARRAPPAARTRALPPPMPLPMPLPALALALLPAALPGASAPLRLEDYRATLERDDGAGAPSSVDRALRQQVLQSFVECSNSPNHTSDVGADALLRHADAELALWGGDLRAAVRHTCGAMNSSTDRKATVCLGHSLAASRSPGGREYARMVISSTQPMPALPPVRTNRSTARARPTWAALLAGAAPAASRPPQLVGHVGDGSSPLHSVYSVPEFLTEAECTCLLDAAESAGSWILASHTPYPTADIHLDALTSTVEDSAAMRRWVGTWVASRVYPLLAELYAVEPGSLWLKEAVLIKYLPAVAPTSVAAAPMEANASGGRQQQTQQKQQQVPAGVAEHRDASVFSFNILLNDAREMVEGDGGTLFPQLVRSAPPAAAAAAAGGGGHDEAPVQRGRQQEEMQTEDERMVRLGRGGGVFHAGKALHAGRPLLREGSRRYLLAGFVQLCSLCGE